MSDLPERVAAARAQVVRGEFEAASESCRAILAEKPNCLPALRIQGYASLELGRYPLAEQAFRQAAIVDAEDELARVGLAICAEQRGDLRTTLAEIQRAGELAPDDPGIGAEIERLGGTRPATPLAQARRAVLEGQARQALDYLEGPVRDGDLAAKLTLASALWELNRKDEIWTMCSEIARDQPNCIRALLWLRAVGPGTGRTLQVRTITRDAEEIDPGLTLFRGVKGIDSGGPERSGGLAARQPGAEASTR